MTTRCNSAISSSPDPDGRIAHGRDCCDAVTFGRRRIAGLRRVIGVSAVSPAASPYPSRAQTDAAVLWGVRHSQSMPTQAPTAEDEAAFSDFYLRTVRRVTGSIALVTRDLHAAEDAAQEAYCRAASRWTRVRHLDRPDLWVVRVGINVAISSWKRHRREGPLDHAPDGIQHDDYSHADRVIAEKTLQWGLEHLTPRQRAAVVMHHAEGWPVDHVARSLGTSQSTVRTHLRRAQDKLRDLLGREGLS